MGKCLEWVTLSYLAVATDRASDLDVNKCDGKEVFPPWGEGRRLCTELKKLVPVTVIVCILIQIRIVGLCLPRQTDFLPKWYFIISFSI